MPWIYWWYGYVPKKLYGAILVISLKIYHYFSIPFLARHLFSPWKRDVVGTEGQSFDVILKVAIFNLVPRIVGFFVRSVTIFAGLLTIVLNYLLGIILILIWFGLPLIIGFLILMAIIMLTGGNNEMAI